jgi:hypothetical protein
VFVLSKVELKVEQAYQNLNVYLRAFILQKNEHKSEYIFEKDINVLLASNWVEKGTAFLQATFATFESCFIKPPMSTVGRKDASSINYLHIKAYNNTSIPRRSLNTEQHVMHVNEFQFPLRRHQESAFEVFSFVLRRLETCELIPSHQVLWNSMDEPPWIDTTLQQVFRVK